MESSVGENCSQMNFTNKTCFEFSERIFWVVVSLRTGLSGLGALMSIVAIVWFIYIARSKDDKGKKIGLQPAARLALYLCIASLFNGIITAIQIVPVSGGLICGRVVANGFCTTAAVLITYSVWTILVLMVWMFIAMIMAALRANGGNTAAEGNGENTAAEGNEGNTAAEGNRGDAQGMTRIFNNKIENKNSLCSKYYDVFVIATTLSIPIIFSHIPLLKSNYGLAGAWCWIKARDDECQKIEAGIAEQFAVWYVWAMLFIIVFVFTIVLYCCCKKECCSYLYIICPFFSYLSIFTVIYGFGFANRIIYASHETTTSWLWIVHGVADAAVSLMIALLILLSLGCPRLYHFCCPRLYDFCCPRLYHFCCPQHYDFCCPRPYCFCCPQRCLFCCPQYVQLQDQPAEV